MQGGNQIADQYTVPMWEKYCKEMEYDFFHQATAVDESYPMGWNIPIIWRQLLGKTDGWKWVWMWQWDSMPVKFTDGIEEIAPKLVIGGERRHKVSLWCPSDCDDVYSDSLAGCHGPMLSGCLARSQKKSGELMSFWWGLRDNFEREPNPPKRGLKKTQMMDYHNDMRFWDMQSKYGKYKSSHIKSFDYDKKYGNDKVAMINGLLEKPSSKYLVDILDNHAKKLKSKKSKIVKDTGDVMGFEPEDMDEMEKSEEPIKEHKYVELDPMEEMNAWAEREGILDPNGDLSPEQRKSLTQFLASRITEEL